MFSCMWLRSRHYAAVSTAKQSASYQSPVEEKSGAVCPRNVDGGEPILSYFMDETWHPRERWWTRDSVGDILEITSISEPCRDVTWSQRIFETTIEHVKSQFPLDIDCFKVNKIFRDDGYRLKFFGNVFKLKYIPEDLDDIQYLLTSHAGKCVASRYEQALKVVFQPLAFGNKNVLFWPPVILVINNLF